MRSLMRTKGFIYANAVVFFFLVNAAATAFNCRWDWSRDRINSLTGSTKSVLNRMQNPVLVEAYITTDVPGELRSLLAPVVSQVEELSRIGGSRVTVRIINPDSEEKKAQAEARGIQGIPIEQQRVDEVSQRLGFFGVFIQVGRQDVGSSACG
jgi:ABC-2 type transport system permease protein